MSYLLLADSHTYVCRTWDDLAAKLAWAREEGYTTAKARRANGRPGDRMVFRKAGPVTLCVPCAERDPPVAPQIRKAGGEPR